MKTLHRAFGFFLVLFVMPVVIAAAGPVLKKVKLGPQVNSPGRELLPMISADGRTLFFTREYYIDAEVRERAIAQLTKGLDEKSRAQTAAILKSSMTDDSLRSFAHQTIWFSEKQVDGSWGAAKKMAPPLNNEFSSWACSALPDNNTLLVGGRFGPGAVKQDYDFVKEMKKIAKEVGKEAEKGADFLTIMQKAKPPQEAKGEKAAASAVSSLIVATTLRAGDKWSEPSYLKIEGFSTYSNRNDFYLAPGNRVLILSIANQDGPGGRDLFASFRKTDGTWSRPQPLGANVNGVEDEVTPFVAADGGSLYFASNRQEGFGGYDIYLSRRQDETWLNWSPAVNLGPELNTSEDEIDLTVDGMGRYAFLSAGPNSAEDIYVFELAPEMRPAPVAFVFGRVHDPAGKPVAASVSYERLRDGVGAGEANSDRLSGKYRIGLAIGESYSFRAEAAGYIPVSDHIDLTKARPGEEFKRDLLLIPIKPGATIRLNNLFFEFAKTTLLPESGVELKKLVQILQRYPKMEIMIAGHTDDIGDDRSNQSLSEGRAAAVVKYLVEHGIAAGRLQNRGYGEGAPVVANDTDEHRQLNRRVEFTILKME